MVFSNLVFLFIFLPIVIIAYYIAPRIIRNYLLLCGSLIFYAWGEPQYIFLMIFSIVMNYAFGLLIHHAHPQRSLKKFFLFLAILGNILILGYYKYANFVVENVNSLLDLQIHLEPLALPIGISFFTFQAMSYIIDVYRKDVEVQRHFIDLALYISLFPQLVAGPIVRYNTVSEQIKKRVHSSSKFAEGIRRFIIGLSKKVLIANPLGEVADAVFALSANDMSTATAWIGIIAYTLQIYFDFSGYSDMAIGLGKIFGFKFLENFNYPYISQSIGEFWRRWHISLSAWFKDYVYIPLGGSRSSKWVTYRNLLIVWTITGFWHGASWTFMAWGFYYGVLIVMERTVGFRRLLAWVWRPIRHAYVLFLVMIGWVFFRADNFTYSFEFIQTMFGVNKTGLVDLHTFRFLHDDTYLFLIAIVFSLPIYQWIKEYIKKTPPLFQGTIEFVYPYCYLGLLIMNTMFLVNSTFNPFIYFRF